MDLAAHEIMEQTPTDVFTASKILVIGVGLNKEQLADGFDKVQS